MKTKSFESKIQQIAQSFDRRPPEKTWEQIQRQLPVSKGPLEPNPGKSLAIAMTMISLAILIGLWVWPRMGSQVEWLENYWQANELARQQNKPLLLLFTKNCPACDSLDRILQQAPATVLLEEFVPVRLSVDDRALLDSAAFQQVFPDQEKLIGHDANNHRPFLQLEDREENFENWGQVWQALQRVRFLGNQQPTIAILSPQEKNLGHLDYSLFTRRNPTVGPAEGVNGWLELNLEIFKNGYAPAALLYQQLCTSCHSSNMQDDLTGPALGGVRDRWKGYPEKDLYRFIRNAQEMIAQGHPKAVENWREWTTVMIAFPSLTDPELKQILDYIDWRFAQKF